MSRQSRVTADVTLEAHNLLRDYCKKHERSKGFLLEKMIRKFCSGDIEPAVPTKVNVARVEESTVKVKRFVPPTWKEVAHYMFDKRRIHMDEEANKFCDFYESNGWKVGKNKMKCWKAAVRNWLKGNNNGSNQSAGKKLSAYERARAANAEYRQEQPNECQVGMGTNDGHLGGAMDAGTGGVTIEHVGDGAFIDYEQSFAAGRESHCK